MTTVALTFMLSLGAMLKPIQEFGVSPSQAIHLLVSIGGFVPIMKPVGMPEHAFSGKALAEDEAEPEAVAAAAAAEAVAAAKGIAAQRDGVPQVRSLQEYHTKMQS